MDELIRFVGAIALTRGLLLAFMLGILLLAGNKQRERSFEAQGSLALLWPLLKIFSWLHFDYAVDGRLKRTAASDSPRTGAPESNSAKGRSFRTERAAKEYLVEQIVAEAVRQGMALTDVERKMLYFSESGWTLPGIMQVNEEFERDYDEAAYERKIAALTEAIESRNSAEDAQAQADWDSAIAKLAEGDHYLLVLLGSNADLRPPNPWLPASPEQLERFGRPRGDLGRMLLVIFALFLVLMALRALGLRFPQ